MNKKKVIICIILVVVLVLYFGISTLRNNNEFGSDLYGQACELSVKLDSLVTSIDQVMREFEKADFDPASVDTVATWYFEFSLNEIRYDFGYEDMPILDEVRLDYIDRAWELYEQIENDSGNEKLAQLLTDEAKRSELIGLKTQLEFARHAFVDFRERYNEIPNWKRYFVSWKNERERLTEKLRIPK